MAKNSTQPGTEEREIFNNGFSQADLAVMSADEVLASLMSDAKSEEITPFQGVPIFDKATLVGKPFVIVQFSFNDSDKGDRPLFVSVTVINEAKELGIFNDGSTGVCSQLESFTEKMGFTPEHKVTVKGPIVCNNGLRRSDYPNPTGAGISTTYYLT